MAEDDGEDEDEEDEDGVEGWAGKGVGDCEREIFCVVSLGALDRVGRGNGEGIGEESSVQVMRRMAKIVPEAREPMIFCLTLGPDLFAEEVFCPFFWFDLVLVRRWQDLACT